MNPRTGISSCVLENDRTNRMEKPRERRMCSSSPNIIVPFSILSYSLRHSTKSS